MRKGTDHAINTRYTLDHDTGVLVSRDKQVFGYSDGEEAENNIHRILKMTGDVSVASDELAAKITDWPCEYHLSAARHNLFIPLSIPRGTTVLELGCGMGAITRYLGEIGANVTAVESSLRRAAVARERCRDLRNVTVICDNFRNLAVDAKFDLVTLIGVMEYAPKYIGGDDPAVACVRIAGSHLKPGGSLLVRSAAVFTRHATLRELVTDVFMKMGMAMTEAHLDQYCRMDAEIQAQVAIVHGSTEDLTGKFKSIFTLPIVEALRIRTRLPVWDLCGLLESEKAARDRQLRKALDQCASSSFEMGTLYLEKGEQARAQEMFEKAVQCEPGNMQYQRRLADFLTQAGRLEEAMQICLGIIQEHPAEVWALVAVGDFCVSRQSLDNARIFYGRALALDPGNGSLRQKIAGLATGASGSKI